MLTGLDLRRDAWQLVNFPDRNVIKRRWCLANCSCNLTKSEIVAVRPSERMMPWLEWKHAVKAHARGSAPDNHIAVLEQHALDLVGALKAAEKEDAFKP